MSETIRLSYRYIFRKIANVYKIPVSLIGEMYEQNSSYDLGKISASNQSIKLHTFFEGGQETEPRIRGSKYDLVPMIQILINKSQLASGHYIIDGYWSSNVSDRYMLQGKNTQNVKEWNYYISDKTNLTSIIDPETQQKSALVDGWVWNYNPLIRRWVLAKIT